MKSIQLSQQAAGYPQSTKKNVPEAREQEEMMNLFPLPKYFQVHFANIHENSDAIKNDMAVLKRDIALVEAKIDRLLMLSVHPSLQEN